MSIMYGNNKKSINDSGDVHFDSGYTSTASLSYHHTTSANTLDDSPLLSNANHTSSKRSLELETIAESSDIPVLVSPIDVETPTTKSIRQLNAFHIQTPQNDKNVLETTPTKSNYFFNSINVSRKSSHKKSRAASKIAWSPYKRLSHKKGHLSEGASFDDQLKWPDEGRHLFSSFESNENDLENVENNFVGNAANQSIECSPIDHHNRSMVAPQVKYRSMQRHHSGIESSTPKSSSLRRTNTQLVTGSYFDNVDEKHARLLRKTQSFSPAKRGMSILKENSTNLQAFQEKDDEQAENEGPERINPAKVVLTFTNNQFEAFLNRQANASSATSNDIPIPKDKLAKNVKLFEGASKDATNNESPRKSLKLKRMATLRRQARITCESPRKAKTPKKTQTSTSSISHKSVRSVEIFKTVASDDMDISPRKTVSATVTSGKEESVHTSSVSDTNAIKSNVDVLLNMPILVKSPVRNKTAIQVVQQIATRTPIKKLERSTSYNPSSTTCLARPDKEFKSIIYDRLPCTPPKGRPIKRSAVELSTHKSSTGQPSAKRKLYDICPPPMFYNGLEKFDILTHLDRNNMPQVLQRIFRQLDDRDLQAAYNVCKSWRKLIKDDSVTHVRRSKYFKTIQSQKENPRATVRRLRAGSLPELQEKRKAFNCLNLQYSLRPHVSLNSPPVSPSKRKFQENQKIVQRLKPGQRLTRCPRCNGNSIVHDVIDDTADLAPKSPPRVTRSRPHLQFTKNTHAFQSCPLMNPNEVMSDYARGWKSFNDRHLNRTISEYAVCTRESCAFEFCTNCQGQRHIDSACPLRPLGSSPTSDEETVPRISSKRVTRRNLRRLLNS